MARGITESDVHAAADALVAGGERPTVERIRVHLGTGSPNTVVRWLETWWRKLGGRLAAQQAKLDLPAAPAELVALTSQWWEHALAAAQRHADARLAEQRTDLVARHDDLAARESSWQEQIHQQIAVADQARQSLVVAQQRLADLQRLCDQQLTQIADLTIHREGLHNRCNRLEQELGELQGRYTEREAMITVERTRQTDHVRAIEDRAHAEIDRARQEAQGLQKQLSSAQREHQKFEQHARQQEDSNRQALAEALREAAIERARADTLAVELQRATASKRPTSRQKSAVPVTRKPRRAAR
ncbi:DNA-binding protein [Xanthomonas campestris]|uniref:DNA-binding protein n=1 Tax=Xanthomonas campestris pv. papavericola TaxID=487881 RepID=A0AAJ2X6U1_XANCA|nr:DNA-binding protein [Xanthomonas campestris]MEC3889798.1 DNA-binding protein [Xanthomonas campestris pv. papavericola]